MVGVAAELLAGVSRQQQHRRAVDAARERDRDRLVRRARGDPVLQTARAAARRRPRQPRRTIGRAASDRRLEEALIARGRIRAAHLIELDDVVGRHHARVGRIELPADPLLLAPREDPVHAVGDDQERTVVHLRDEVAQRQPDRPRQPHGLAVAPDRREVTVGASRAPRRRSATVHSATCGVRRAGQPGRSRPDEIDEAIDTFKHLRALRTSDS